MKCVIKGPDGKCEIHTINKNSVTIGRSNTCDIPILSESLSRVHCQLYEEEGEIYILDLNSTNGVYINDERIEPNVKKKLVNFLNVKIAFIYELNVVPDHEKPEQKIDLSIDFETTKTKDIRRPISRTKEKTPQTKKTDSQINKNILMSLLVILGGIYYFNLQSTHEENETLSQPEQTQEVVLTEKIEDKRLERNEIAKNSTYDSIFQQLSESLIRSKFKCNEVNLEPFCSPKGKLDEHEGFFIVDGVLYGYFSFEKEKNRFNTISWSGDREDEIRIVILNLFSDSIVQKYEEIQISKFKLVLYDSNDSGSKNLIAASIDYKNSKIIGTEAYYSSISKIQSGDFSDIKILLDELIIHKFQ
jgi:pSer/pThr/pTyr-binding forkhead associated (FHA) protein